MINNLNKKKRILEEEFEKKIKDATLINKEINKEKFWENDKNNFNNMIEDEFFNKEDELKDITDIDFNSDIPISEKKTKQRFIKK